MTISLDYECYSEADLTEVGGWRYAEDPSTEVLCFAWSINGGEPVPWYEGRPPPRPLYERIKAGDWIDAYNANFERAITELVVRRHLPDFPMPLARQWRCSQAAAAMCALPIQMGLEGVATVLKARHRKDKEGERLMAMFSWPRKPTKADPRRRILPSDEPREFGRYVAYCLQDVRAEQAMKAKLPIRGLGVAEQRIWTVDSNINRRGVKVDLALARGALEIQKGIQTVELARLVKLTDGKITTSNQTARIKDFCKAHKFVIPSLGKELVITALEGDLPPVVREVLKIRLSLAKATTAKYVKAIESASIKRARIRGTTQYHVATTGRWGGRLFQTHNMARPLMNVEPYLDLIRTPNFDHLQFLFSGDVMGVLRDAIRHVIIAAKGRVLNVVDLASIEARVLGWLAREAAYIDAFRKGLDLYVVTAASIYQVAYDLVTDLQRFLGKESVLGLGYSMGFKTFLANCRRKRALRDVSPKLIQKAHAAYRKTYRKIVKYWYDVERCALGAVTTKKPMMLRELRFEMVDHYFTILLPSGRRLWYPFAEVRMVTMPWGEMKPAVTFMTYIADAGGWVRSSTYGGRLVENIVQAVARDILAETLVELERIDHPVVMHVHDEIVTETEGPRLDELIRVISKTPTWAPGLPLGAKGFTSTIYRKD